MMTRLCISLPDATLTAVDAVAAPFKRSQFLHYAAAAMLARLRGDVVEAVGFEAACRALVGPGAALGGGGPRSPPGAPRGKGWSGK